MRWRILLSIGRWQLLAVRCPQCGLPKLGLVCDGVMREWPNTTPQRMARPSAGATYAGGDGSVSDSGGKA